MKLFKAILVLLIVAALIAAIPQLSAAQSLVLAAAASIAVFGLVGNRPLAGVHGNTLTDLIPDFYAALDVVNRELVGFIPAVMRDSRADRCALGATMRSHVAPANAAAGNVTPAMAFPSAADQTFSNKTFSISKSRFAPFSWTGEEQGAMDSGPGYLNLRQDQIAQAIRALVNEVEYDIAVAAYKGASRAYGATAGTAPVLADFANAKKILDDNGAPVSDRHAVIDTTAGVALRGTSNLYKVNESGESSLLRQGILGNLYGMDIRESAQVQTPTSGTMASATTSAAALTVGQTVLPLATAGTGVVAAGDIITIANDSNKYVVESVSFAGANPASGDSITIAAPGLRKAQSSAARNITVFGTSTRNMVFNRSAILLGTRLPATVKEGDLARDREIITDPYSGLTFELVAWPGVDMVTYHVRLAWGVSVLKPEHVATIIG